MSPLIDKDDIKYNETLKKKIEKLKLISRMKKKKKEGQHYILLGLDTKQM